MKKFFRSMSQVGTGTLRRTEAATEETVAYQYQPESHTARATRGIAPARRNRLPLVAVCSAAAALLVILGSLMLLTRPGDAPQKKPSAAARDQAQKKEDERTSELDARKPDSKAPEPTPSEDSPETAWAKTDADTKALILDQRFGEAQARYTELGERLHDLEFYSRTEKAVAALKEQAKTAYGEAEARARQLADEHKFAEARDALQPVIDRYGIAEHVEAAKSLLAEIHATEKQAQEDAATTAAIEEHRGRETRYAEALKPAEELVAAWDFHGALAALAKVQFEEKDLAARLEVWRAGAERLADLKARIIAKINAADPPLKKSDLMIRGVGGEVAEAGEDRITAKLPRGKTESLAWQDVGPQAIENLVELAGGANSPDDWLAAAVLALASKDPTSAKKHFEQARSLGAEIGPYLAPLAATAFTEAKELLKADDFGKAVSSLEEIEKKYANVPWFTANKRAFDAAFEHAKARLYEQEAEALFAEAAELYAKQELFDLGALVKKLKKEYADSRAVTDTERKPSFAELERAIENLGQFITVRQDGKEGSFTTIQAAIDAAPPNSLIEIQDEGSYQGPIVVPQAKAGLSIRGQKGSWPIVRMSEPTNELVVILATETSLERLVIARGLPATAKSRPLVVRAGAFRLHSTIIYSEGPAYVSFESGVGTPAEIRDSLLVAATMLTPGFRVAIRNSLFLKDIYGGRVEFGSCTLFQVRFAPEQAGALTDSIVGTIANPAHLDYPIDHCNVSLEAPPRQARNCLSADPQFRDPANLDYQLMPTSPCIGRASDGGDIGCRYTPEMIEMVQKALELRAKGIIKF